ncbi:MAG: hypothetical protein ABEL04_04710 [Salinibacter sp.]|uniref:hypothetical protein n=1 Tax=Salinibacter sp. TaxID=2065818 RepID=UPI0035D4DE1F
MGLFGFGSSDKDQSSVDHARVAANIVMQVGYVEIRDNQELIEEQGEKIGVSVDIDRFAEVCAGTFAELTLFSFENTEDIVYEDAEDSFVSELNDE